MTSPEEALREPTLPVDSIMRLALRSDSLLFSPAQNTDQLIQSYQLVYKNYLRCEYIEAHPSQMRYTVYNALPTTATFVARLDGSVVTTATVVLDSPLGLPLEAIYGQEIAAMRADGARICEVTMLADRRRAGMRTIPAILRLFKMMFNYASGIEDITDIVITVNPSHEAFYTRYLPFQELGTLRYYPSVRNAPAVAKRINFSEITEEVRSGKIGAFFFEDPTPQDILSVRSRFTEEELRDLFVIRRDIFHKLPPFALDYVRSLYPQYDFDRILAPVE
jgi:hypothetical protein